MKPRKAFSALVAAVLSVVAPAFSANAEHVPGEVIVKYKQGVVLSRAEANAIYSRAGVEHVRYFTGSMSDHEQLILKDGVKVEDALRALRSHASVEYAQPNFVLRMPEAPGAFEPPPGTEPLEGLPCIPGMEVPDCDPSLCWLPGLPMPPGCTDWSLPGNPGEPGNPPAERPPVADAPADVAPPVADPQLSQAWGISKVAAEQVWPTHRGNKSFVVAVIDTGIDYNHEDLSFNVWRNPNPTQGDLVGFDFIHNDGLPYDDQGHGTHTAGTVGAVGGNGKAVSGVVQQVSIMGLKFLSSGGSGTTADAIRAIDYAIEHGAKVLSNSWGGRGDAENNALHAAIERAKAKDVLFVAAAGNESVNNDSGAQASYPAAFDNDNLIAVAATDNADRMASFSNYGRVSTDLAAPGVNVYSLSPGNKYASHSGTSMACPHVAGAAALIWSKNPALTYKQVKDLLLGSVDKIAGLETKVLTGGRLNVAKALRSME
ncbi:MAG: S8 family serine peptidase [Bdellovibrionales bacterium]|nr:S8 family serine peptidase [Bdellovibrionales bacterium]